LGNPHSHKHRFTGMFEISYTNNGPDVVALLRRHKRHGI